MIIETQKQPKCYYFVSSTCRELKEDIADINFEGEEKREGERKSAGSDKMDVSAMIEAELLTARERTKKEREEREEEERRVHVRPWDKGKGEGREEEREGES